MKILKFGGSSLKDGDSIKNAVKIINTRHPCGVVVSASSGITNKLIELINHRETDLEYKNLFDDLVNHHMNILDELGIKNSQTSFSDDFSKLTQKLKFCLESISKKRPSTLKLKDEILSYGELLSANIITRACITNTINVELLDARKLILTDDNYGNASVNYKVSNYKIRKSWNKKDTTKIIPGFIGATEKLETTTLGRNGSDHSASIIGAALNVKKIEIWSDVNGILAANPNIIPDAKTIPYLTYNEAIELANSGAKVLFPGTIVPLLNKSIPLHIKNVFEPNNCGTLIKKNREITDHSPVGISAIDNISLIKIQLADNFEKNGLTENIFRLLIKEKIKILVAVGASITLIGIIYSLLLTPMYRASVLMADASESEGSGLSAYASRFSGLASLAGINISGGSTGKTTALATIRSRSFILKFIYDNVVFETTDLNVSSNSVFSAKFTINSQSSNTNIESANLYINSTGTNIDGSDLKISANTIVSANLHHNGRDFTSNGINFYGNTNDFINGWRWSNHTIDCTVIAEDNNGMQRDGWYSKACDFNDLQSLKDISKEAARRATMRLGARKLSTGEVPVIFEAPVGLIVVTPATSELLTVKLSLIIIVVESVDLIVLPDISIVPNVCVAPEPVILVPVIAPALSVPVVVKFSLPNDIAPLESVIEPFVNDILPVDKVGAVNDVVTDTALGNPIVSVSVALTTASISFEVPKILNVSPPPIKA